MKKLTIIFIILFGVAASILLLNMKSSNIEDTIANFPIDETKQFSKATTLLQLIEQNDEDEYTIEWKTYSKIPEKMLLSHDISLLFEDGRLKETMNAVKDRSNELQQKLKITGEDSGHYETITFHYGQIDYPNEEKRSVQSMSFDQLYILDTPLSPIEFFKIPEAPSEIEGKRILDTIIQQNLQYTWQELIDYFQIPESKYLPVPLTKLYMYNTESFPQLTQDETREILALTWEAIYKYYFLGIEKHDGTQVSPFESCVPLVLFHKSYSHFLIIFNDKDGGKYNIIKNTQKF